MKEGELALLAAEYCSWWACWGGTVVWGSYGNVGGWPEWWNSRSFWGAVGDTTQRAATGHKQTVQTHTAGSNGVLRVAEVGQGREAQSRTQRWDGQGWKARARWGAYKRWALDRAKPGMYQHQVRALRRPIAETAGYTQKRRAAGPLRGR